MSAKVFDFFSKKALGTKQDTEENDIRSKVDGKYVGNVGKNNATAFQQTIKAIESLVGQVMILQESIEEYGDMHEANTDYIIKVLGVKNFDMETQELMVSEDGHVWIVEANPEGWWNEE